MPKDLHKFAISIAVFVTLFGWPLLLPDSVSRWITTGVLAPGAWLPPVLVFIVAGCAISLGAGIGGLMVVPALLISLVLAIVYAQILWSISRQRRELRQRSDTELEGNALDGVKLGADSQTAIGLIASVVRVPRQKLRWSDRFGSEIGTFSSLDETLDRLGGKLLLEQLKADRPLLLEHIKTIGDYVTEWMCCNRGAKDSDEMIFIKASSTSTRPPRANGSHSARITSPRWD